IRVLELAFHVDAAIRGGLARDVEERAARARPHLPPLAAARQVERVARARGAARAFPMLLEGATAVALRDGVRARERAVRHPHFPAAEPEVELASGFDRLARIHARAHVLVHALEPAAGAIRVELVRALHEF